MEMADELMLPGFRFHPTDEELVGFYLKRKIQKKPLSVELIRQLDIYKYDPWDLPKLGTTGEKEWYFYCLRDRKYRNSARPNRVTGAGFWKATGTDRPIYSSEGGTKCIGLKKSLVFYKGRAARGIKTDWMMHEFRLPSLSDPSMPARHLDKNIPDSWAICRIFKKTNPSAQRAMAHSWMVPPLPDNSESDMFSVSQTESIQFGFSNGLQQQDSNLGFSPPDNIFMSSLAGFSVPSKSVLGEIEKASVTIDFEQTQQDNESRSGLPIDAGRRIGEEDQWGALRSFNFPFNLPSDLSDEWKSGFPWDSQLCPSEVLMGYSSNECYT